MFDIFHEVNRTGDAISRRSLLRVGSLAVGGLTLPNLLRSEAAALEAGFTSKRRSVILVWQAGGPSHIDMYDLKPNAPPEYRGEFKPKVQADNELAKIKSLTVGDKEPSESTVRPYASAIWLEYKKP